MTTPLVVAPDPLSALTEPMRWLMTRAAPDDPAMDEVKPSATLESLCDAWLKNDEVVGSAIRLIAAVLPSRESIWWAWVSVRHVTMTGGGPPATKEVHATLGAIEQWIVRPDDTGRRTVWDAGNVAGLDTPSGMIAAAVFLSGTSVTPVGAAAVPPPPGAAMPLVAGAIQLAAATVTPPEQVLPTMRAFAVQGLEIVKRLGGWDAALQLAHDTHLRMQAEYDRATAPPPAK